MNSIEKAQLENVRTVADFAMNYDLGPKGNAVLASLQALIPPERPAHDPETVAALGRVLERFGNGEIPDSRVHWTLNALTDEGYEVVRSEFAERQLWREKQYDRIAELEAECEQLRADNERVANSCHHWFNQLNKLQRDASAVTEQQDRKKHSIRDLSTADVEQAMRDEYPAEQQDTAAEPCNCQGEFHVCGPPYDHGRDAAAETWTDRHAAFYWRGRWMVATRERDERDERIAEHETDIEHICDELIRLGPWDEIDGDGTPGSIICDNIRWLIRERDERIAEVEALVRLANDLQGGWHGLAQSGFGWTWHDHELTSDMSDLILSIVDEGGENDG